MKHMEQGLEFDNMQMTIEQMMERLPVGSMIIKCKTGWQWTYGIGGRYTDAPTLRAALEAAMKKIGGGE